MRFEIVGQEHEKALVVKAKLSVEKDGARLVLYIYNQEGTPWYVCSLRRTGIYRYGGVSPSLGLPLDEAGRVVLVEED